MKRILITGAGSYIGTTVERWLARWPTSYAVRTLDVKDETWRMASFADVDVVFHVAGIAHVSSDPSMADLYYRVNRDLTLEVAAAARAAGVRQFIFMSSAIVYGSSQRLDRPRLVDADTAPSPDNFYGRSKLEAEEGLAALRSPDFKVVVLRPPMIYGPGSKGNYPVLAKLARTLPIFPDYPNRRSMLFVDNLAEFVKLMIDNDEDGLFHPQNRRQVSTGELAAAVAAAHGRRLKLTHLGNPVLRAASGRVGAIAKAFGSLSYEPELSVYAGGDYQVADFAESIRRTEQGAATTSPSSTVRRDTAMPLTTSAATDPVGSAPPGAHILVVSQYFYPENFRINDLTREWVRRGYRVTVLTGIPNYPQGHYYKGYGPFGPRYEDYEGVRIVRIPLVSRGESTLRLALNYASFAVSGEIWQWLTRLRPNLVFVFEVSPMTQALPAVRFAARRGIPCFIYVQDLWPESVQMAAGIHDRRVIARLDSMVHYIYRRCARIFVTSRSYARSIAARGVPSDRIVYWPQYAEPVVRIPVPDGVLARDERMAIVFAGNLGVAQGLDILPEAARRLKDAGHASAVRFVVIGDGRFRSTLVDLIDRYAVADMFHLVPRQPPELVPELLARCDIAYLSFQADPLLDQTIPAKLQTYLSCGIPVLASAGGEVAAILAESGAGLSCSPGNADALTTQVLTLLARPRSELTIMGEAGRRYCARHFDRDRLLAQMDDCILAALSAPPSRED